MPDAFSAERWEALQRLFDELVDLPPEDRAVRLRALQTTEPALHEKLEDMLSAYEAASAFFEPTGSTPSVPPVVPTPDAGVTVGQQVAHYVIQRMLGKGGMGVVYQAEDTRLGRTVALKCLPPEWSADEKAKRQLMQEARTIAALDHPNVCTIHDVAELDTGQLFITMAYYPGQTLKQKLEAGPLPWEEALDFTLQTARGLGQAHRKGIIHRDIKPGNLIVTDEGRIKILDFGLARHMEQHATTNAPLVGTVAYMSPEQAQGRPLDPRTDIWSLGIVLYEMLTGQRPFMGDYPQAILYQIVHEDPLPLTERNPALPPALAHLVQLCLEKDPALRYPDVADLVADLELARTGDAVTRTLTLPGIAEAPPSIAVLPFVDMSAQQDQAYFSDGMTEELSDALAQVDAWRVVSSTSAFAFKGRDLDVREIGRQLNASHILAGSVRMAGARVRVRAQLSSVHDGFQLWSERYQRELEDIFAIQEDIAQHIVATLKVKLGDQPPPTLVQRRTDNLEVYQLYLKARFQLNKRTDAALHKCRAYCQQALALDDTYAPVYAALADSLVLLGFQGAMPAREAWPQAKAAAEQALALDATLAEAHTSLGCLRAVLDWDWPGAEAAFQQALALNPNHATAHHWYAIWYLIPQGRFVEAAAALATAQEIDPVSLVLSAGRGWCAYFAGAYDTAVDQLQKTLDMDPTFAMAHDLLGQTYLQQGRTEKGLETLKRAVAVSNGRALSRAALGHAYAVAGYTPEAQAIIDDLKTEPDMHYDVALIHAGLGDRAEAFQELERAYDAHAGWLVFLNVEPRWNSLHADPTFKALLHRIGLA